MRTFDFDATHQLLPYAELADELRAVLRDKKAGLTIAPPRIALPLAEDGLLLTMPAADQNIAITKLVTVHPRNAALGLPVIQGEVIVMNAKTGERLMQLDGKAVTMRRTAALSLLAAQALASDDAKRGPLLIVGAGAQGRAHLEAFAAGFPALDVFIASRTFDDARALAQLGPSLGMNAQAIGSADDVLPVCGMVITATTSATPVIPDRVRAGAFVAAVGAYQASMAELPPELVRRSCVVVDTLEGAQHEAGDLIQAGVDWDSVTALEDVDAHTRPPTPPQREGETMPIIFKSVGHALWDLAAARLAARHAA
jgi:ornithine cyclodeaminase